MNSSICTSRPLSWLLLEQYQLGELSVAEKARVTQHLDACPGCAKCMRAIENDAVRLKPLPEIKASWWQFALEPKWILGMGAAATAAIALLALLFVWPVTQVKPEIPSATIGYKGGDLAVALVRKRNEQVNTSPRHFMAGDVFQLEVTCPPIGEVEWDVTLFQGSEVFFPYDNSHLLECGNHIALPGGFSLSGNRSTVVCITIDEPVEREDVQRIGIRALPNSTVCTQLIPVQ